MSENAGQDRHFREARARVGRVWLDQACFAWAHLLIAAIIGLAAPPAQSAETPETRDAVGRIFADRHMTDSALQVHRRAVAMPTAERYRFLLEWVIPSSGSVRVVVDFTPTCPAPPVAEHDEIDTRRIAMARQRGQKRVLTGGRLVSPALDLVAAAKEVGKLDEVRARLVSSIPPTASQQRARLALLTAVDLAAGDIPSALQSLDALYPLIVANEADDQLSRSADMLAIHVAIEDRRSREFARDAASHLLMRCLQTSGGKPAKAWETQLAAMLATVRQLDRDVSRGVAEVRAEMALAPDLREWAPSSRMSASSRGLGHAPACWQLVDERITNRASHADDLLYYHVPLQGSFQVQAELQTRDHLNTELIVGGHWAEPLYWGRQRFQFGDLRGWLRDVELDPTLTKYVGRARMLVAVEDDTVSYFANGRLLHRLEMEGDVDPWIVLRSSDRHDGDVQDLRISGQPVIPTELKLTATNGLTGWLSYYGSSVGTADADWQPWEDAAGGGAWPVGTEPSSPERTSNASCSITGRCSKMAWSNMNSITVRKRYMFTPRWTAWRSCSTRTGCASTG